MFFLLVSCGFHIVGQGISFCLNRQPASSRDVLRFLANRGYPLATFLRFGEDTAFVNEGPLIHMGDLRVETPTPTLVHWARGNPGDVFRMVKVQQFLQWLHALHIPARLFWDNAIPVIRWRFPPPRGQAGFTWNGSGFLGRGNLEAWVPGVLTRIRVEVEGEGDRERARLALLRPLRPLLEGFFEGMYVNSMVPAASMEGGLAFRRGPFMLGMGGHLVWDTLRRGGVIVQGGFSREQDSLALWSLLRGDGALLRFVVHMEQPWGEGEIFALAGTLEDSSLAEPRGGPGRLHGWPGTGRFLHGIRVRGGVGPRVFRGFLEGLMEKDRGLQWDLALRTRIGGVDLWLSRGMPDGQTWVYVTLQME